MRCIICKEDKPSNEFSEEHVFPDSIGGTLIIKSVCKTCNDRLGSSVDCYLTDHWLIKGERLILKIPGKSGKVPNPLEIGVLDGTDQETKYIFNDDGTPKELYLVPSITKVSNEDGSESAIIKIDKKDKDKLPDMINKMRRRKGLPVISKEEIEAQMIEGTIQTPTIKMRAEFDTVQYKRAVLKIAYELAFYWLGQEYFNDETGEIIRNCMFDSSLEGDWSEEYPIKGFIDLSDEQSRFPFWKDETKSHVAFLNIVDNKICCYIKIFNIFEGVIEVSNDASNYPNFSGKFISINPQTGEKRETDLIEELKRIGNANDC